MSEVPKFPPPPEDTPKLSEDLIKHLEIFTRNYAHEFTEQQSVYMDNLINERELFEGMIHYIYRSYFT